MDWLPNGHASITDVQAILDLSCRVYFGWLNLWIFMLKILVFGRVSRRLAPLMSTDNM